MSIMHGVQWWERWYAAGGDSGPGSRGAAAQWKANVVNDFVRTNRVRSVFELGCGDGGQLALLQVPQYTGFDPSKTAVERARARFSCHQFVSEPTGQRADLALSMDVLYHIFDDAERDSYLTTLFASAERFVLIYTTRDSSHDYAGHVWHRSPPDGWAERIDSPYPVTNCSFYVYRIGSC